MQSHGLAAWWAVPAPKGFSSQKALLGQLWAQQKAAELLQKGALSPRTPCSPHAHQHGPEGKAKNPLASPGADANRGERRQARRGGCSGAATTSHEDLTALACKVLMQSSELVSSAACVNLINLSCHGMEPKSEQETPPGYKAGGTQGGDLGKEGLGREKEGTRAPDLLSTSPWCPTLLPNP